MEQTISPLMPGPSSAEVVTTVGRSAASWGSIIAGAAVAASASIILLALGAGLGFASVSPWPDHGVSGKTFTLTTAIWLIVTQWLSAALGGYIAGRLRTRWIGTHNHEVFFRDTAHGLVTWAVATLLVASVLATSAFSLAGHGARAAGEAVGASAGMQDGGPLHEGMPREGEPHPDLYSVDKLFRQDPAATAQGMTTPVQGAAESRLEAARIVGHDLATGSVSDADRAYLSSLVAARTGVPPTEAAQRVDEFIASAHQAETAARTAADAARQAAAEASIYTALSMLVGAFIACVSAALGGRLRDEHP